MTTLKKCGKCGIEKNLEDFYGDKQYWCKQCFCQYKKERYHSRIDVRKKEAKRCKKYRKLHPQKVNFTYHNNKEYRWKNLSKEIGLSTEFIKQWYEKQWMKQQAQCAICGKVFSDNDCIDHDHKTLKLRGLLCNKCNPALGAFEDNKIILNNAINYLSKF